MLKSRFNRKNFLLGSLAGLAGGVTKNFTKTEAKTLDIHGVMDEIEFSKFNSGMIHGKNHRIHVSF